MNRQCCDDDVIENGLCHHGEEHGDCEICDDVTVQKISDSIDEEFFDLYYK